MIYLQPLAMCLTLSHVDSLLLTEDHYMGKPKIAESATVLTRNIAKLT